MAFQKFKADKLFDGYRFTDDDKVLITDEAGVIEDIIAETEVFFPPDLLIAIVTWS